MKRRNNSIFAAEHQKYVVQIECPETKFREIIEWIFYNENIDCKWYCRVLLDEPSTVDFSFSDVDAAALFKLTF